MQRGVLHRARSGKAPAAAAAQILSHVHVSLYQRPAAELATFRQIELITSSFPLTSTLEGSSASAVVAEMLLTFFPPADASEKAFRLGLSCLESLLEGCSPEVVVSYVQYWALALGGVLGPPETENSPLDSQSIEFLEACRKSKVSSIPGLVPNKAAGWLDERVRDEAERPLRALAFHRRLAG
mgnify:CR=1 FL=1